MGHDSTNIEAQNHPHASCFGSPLAPFDRYGEVVLTYTYSTEVTPALSRSTILKTSPFVGTWFHQPQMCLLSVDSRSHRVLKCPITAECEWILARNAWWSVVLGTHPATKRRQGPTESRGSAPHNNYATRRNWRKHP